MLSKKKLIEIIKREYSFLRKNFGVERIAIFGSFAKDIAKKNSDVDIFVEFEKPLGLKFIQMTEYLEKKLGRKTDILTPAGIQSIRIKRIAEDIKRSLLYV